MSEEQEKPKVEYKSEFKKLSFLSIGGLWGYAVITFEDNLGIQKIRLAKCKKKKEFPRTEKGKWEDIDPVNMENLSQVQKINFKMTDNWEILSEKVKESLETLKKETGFAEEKKE
ncbi:MAG: hypothetical protein ACTSXA_08380 [Candidatus Heimdallarchaeota archaeon]